MAGRELVREQVFDKRGTYLGKVARATLSAGGDRITAYEIELDRAASAEIFGEPSRALEVDPMDLYIEDVVRLGATIAELRQRVLAD